MQTSKKQNFKRSQPANELVQKGIRSTKDCKPNSYVKDIEYMDQFVSWLVKQGYSTSSVFLASQEHKMWLYSCYKRRRKRERI